VNSCEQKGKKDGRFEVIVGKSMVSEGESKCFGLVNSYDTKPKRRVFEALKPQGMQRRFWRNLSKERGLSLFQLPPTRQALLPISAGSWPLGR
jgi:hypothetical protein